MELVKPIYTFPCREIENDTKAQERELSPKLDGAREREIKKVSFLEYLLLYPFRFIGFVLFAIATVVLALSIAESFWPYIIIALLLLIGGVMLAASIYYAVDWSERPLTTASIVLLIIGTVIAALFLFTLRGSLIGTVIPITLITLAVTLIAAAYINIKHVYSFTLSGGSIIGGYFDIGRPYTLVSLAVLRAISIALGFALAFILAPICFTLINLIERSIISKHTSEQGRLYADFDQRVAAIEKRHDEMLERFIEAVRLAAASMRGSEAMSAIYEELDAILSKGMGARAEFKISIAKNGIYSPYGNITFENEGYDILHTDLELAALASLIYEMAVAKGGDYIAEGGLDESYSIEILLGPKPTEVSRAAEKKEGEEGLTDE